MTVQTAAAATTSHFRCGWIYVLTLALVTINYTDRSALSIVAHAVRGEFKLSPVSGNLCGLLAPIVTGYVVSGLGSYDWALWIAGILLIAGAVALGAMTRSVILPTAAGAPAARPA